MQPNKPENQEVPNVFRELDVYRKQGLSETYFRVDDKAQMKDFDSIVDALERLGFYYKIVQLQGLKFVFLSSEAAEAVKNSTFSQLAVSNQSTLRISILEPNMYQQAGYCEARFFMDDKADREAYQKAVTELSFLELPHYAVSANGVVTLYMPEESALLVGIPTRRAATAHILNAETDERQG